MKNRELAQKINATVHQVRRWSVALLGLDLEAGKSSGVERIYTGDEAFMIFLVGELISVFGMSIADATHHVKAVTHKLMLENLWIDAKEVPEFELIIYPGRQYCLKIYEEKLKDPQVDWERQAEPFEEKGELLWFPGMEEQQRGVTSTVPMSFYLDAWKRIR